MEENKPAQSSKGTPLGNGCLIVILIAILSFMYFYIKGDNGGSSSSVNPCMASETFIKRELNFPSEADFNFLECHTVEEVGNTYTIIRKIKAKNAFGMETPYIYKVKMEYLGGDQFEDENWQLIYIKHEKYIE